MTGTTHMASTGHYLATAVSYGILEQGGNAIDAGVAAGLTLNVVLPQYTSLGGVAPIMVHHAQRNEIKSISGLGRWPQAASIDYFNDNHGGELPPGAGRFDFLGQTDGWKENGQHEAMNSFHGFFLLVVDGRGSRRSYGIIRTCSPPYGRVWGAGTARSSDPGRCSRFTTRCRGLHRAEKTSR